MVSAATQKLVRQRLADERGGEAAEAPFRVAALYPSPYRVAMSSLGFQQAIRCMRAVPGVSVERAFLPDDTDSPGAVVREPPVTYESLSHLGEFAVLAVSVAYELELAGLVKLLDAAAIPAERERRGPEHPLIVCGGPLTFSNPLPLAAFADVIVMGEAEGMLEDLTERLRDVSDREALLDELATRPHLHVPARHPSGAHGDLPAIARAEDARLPARSLYRTPHTELSDMFLIEAERGCSRGCTYCVMRRGTNGGMRIVPAERLLELIPTDARKVGLVGAAVSDHPKITEVLHALSDRGATVGLSSLRPDRLKDEFVEALHRAGYRTLTTALDGPSERLRSLIDRRGREPHYQAAAERARRVGMTRLKLYLMIGLPGETDEDIDECVQFVAGLSRIIPVALGIAPFCSKRNTPLDNMPFAGVRRVQQRLDRLRRGLAGRADVRATSARWAWVEAVLAQGGVPEALALARAVRSGERFADFKREFGALGHGPDGDGYETAVPPIAPERARQRRLPVATAG